MAWLSSSKAATSMDVLHPSMKPIRAWAISDSAGDLSGVVNQTRAGPPCTADDWLAGCESLEEELQPTRDVSSRQTRKRRIRDLRVRNSTASVRGSPFHLRTSRPGK